MVFKQATMRDIGSVWPLFMDLRYDYLLDALIHGFHGHIMIDAHENPAVAAGNVGWTYYLGGDALSKQAQTLIESLPDNIEVIASAAWFERIKTFIPNATKKTRYAMDPSTLKKDHLKSVASSLDQRFKVVPIDKALYDTIMHDATWAQDFVINFENYHDFKENGLGYAVLKDNKIIGGASSYARFNGGYDIEIITHEDYRRQGIAKAVGATFILHTLKQGKIPHWDAAHKGSKRLAEHLGYQLDYTFHVLEL